MSCNPSGNLPTLTAENEKTVLEVLGYLNFSGGKPDARFQKHLNDLFGLFERDCAWRELQKLLQRELARNRGQTPAFENCEQAEAVLAIVFDALMPAYRKFHADLFFHLNDSDFENPLFLARLFEAALAQGGPWNETDRIVSGALRDLNDFLGHRPVAVLESGQQMQPYEHERFRPLPLYIAGAGAAVGPYQELIRRVLDLLESTPESVLQEAHFDLNQLVELALDQRAYDHQHPMNKRTNYMFGEWDPHHIDSKGRYDRFVIRSIIVDALLSWMDQTQDLPREEVLFEAAAVLCGTILMASTISGAGPNAYDSTVSLGMLLPRVARQRDAFYSRLLDSLSGPMAARLRREAQQVRQPFGKVRQHLNLFVAQHGSLQVQHTHLAYLYAKMGYADASRQQAAVIPALSTRFECEIEWRLTLAHLELDRGNLVKAAEIVPAIEDHLHRGINCGALVDPWNILGFQGNFPLFHSREDSVADVRVETLLRLVEQIFGLYARLLSEAAAEGQSVLLQSLSTDFRELAEFWDKFATTTVSGLPAVSGNESWQSADQVALALAEWHAAGEASGDISFWRQHVHRFESAKAYALVLDALLRRADTVAAMGLLIQWLSQAEQVGLESGSYSFHRLIVRWLRLVSRGKAAKPERDVLPEEAAKDAGELDPAERLRQVWPVVVRLFDYLEANAGDYWPVPTLDSLLEMVSLSGGDEGDDDLEDEDHEDDGQDALFSAAYEDVVYRDSARDGIEGDTVDGGGLHYDTDLDLLLRQLEDRLKFQVTLSRLWQMTAAVYAGALSAASPRSRKAILNDEQTAVVERWYARTQELQADLLRLMNAVWRLEFPEPSGDADSLAEYDRQLQMQFSLLNSIVFTHVACHEASWHLASCLPEKVAADRMPAWERQTVALYRSLLRGRVNDVRQQLPTLLKALSKEPLLYVPLDKGGDPKQLLRARTLQSVIRSLLVQLPRLGLFRETWHLLRTAQRMEQISLGAGTVITEFDRLFYAAFRNSLEGLVRDAETWQEDGLDDEELIDLIGTMTDFYLDVWLEHSATMRLSSLEALAHSKTWRKVQKFIKTYGQDFFTAQMLSLGNLRAILHNGVQPFLDYLEEHEDPLHPIKLLQDLGTEIDREEASNYLEIIFHATVEKYDRFVEYNSTTTQSDYGEQYTGFLDFLRVEASYERHAWNLSPLVTAHEVLIRAGHVEAAQIWHDVFRVRTEEAANEHLQWLQKLEEKYGMRLPSITSLLNERFVKPLALDRIMALVPQAIADARAGRPSKAFEMIQAEADAYLSTTTGSGLDVPQWLRSVEDEVLAAEGSLERQNHISEAEVYVPPTSISLDEFRRQLDVWTQALKKPRRKKGGE